MSPHRAADEERIRRATIALAPLVAEIGTSDSQTFATGSSPWQAGKISCRSRLQIIKSNEWSTASVIVIRSDHNESLWHVGYVREDSACGGLHVVHRQRDR